LCVRHMLPLLCVGTPLLCVLEVFTGSLVV
jgi:hypothetical protein